MNTVAIIFAFCLCNVKGDFNPKNESSDCQRLFPNQLTALKTRSINLELPAWTNGIVPFVMDPGFANSQRHTDALNNAIKELQSKTCIKIVKRTNEEHYLNFKNTGPDGQCNSFIGMGPKDMQPQEINIADWCTGDRWMSTVHEIIHALGFIHEQCRPDRDNYVDVNMNNPEAQNINYRKLPIEKSKIVSKYDYDSLMHYPAKENLLTPKDRNAHIGQRDHMSNCDIAKINRYYNCPQQFAQNCERH